MIHDDEDFSSELFKKNTEKGFFVINLWACETLEWIYEVINLCFSRFQVSGYDANHDDVFFHLLRKN